MGTISSEKKGLHFEKVIRASVEEGGRDLRRDPQANRLDFSRSDVVPQSHGRDGE